MARVVILHDPFVDSPTLDEKDSLDTARLISHTLTEQNHQVTCVPLSPNWTETLRAVRQAEPEIVFNLVEELEGDPRLNYMGGILLEHGRLPYTGSRAETLYITTHKLLTKKLLRFHGLPTPEWCTADYLVDFVPGQAYIIKPINLDASVEIHDDALQVFEQPAQLRQHLLDKQSATGIEFFAERYIQGREFWIPMLGYAREPELVAPAEMYFIEEPVENPNHIIGYRAKWHEQSFEYTRLKARYRLPADDPLMREDDIFQILRELALRCWQAFDLRGYPRLDIKIDDQAQPWILEINANPCLTYHPGGIVDAAGQAGIDYPTLLRRILSISPNL